MCRKKVAVSEWVNYYGSLTQTEKQLHDRHKENRSIFSTPKLNRYFVPRRILLSKQIRILHVWQQKHVHIYSYMHSEHFTIHCNYVSVGIRVRSIIQLWRIQVQLFFYCVRWKKNKNNFPVRCWSKSSRVLKLF